MKNQMNRKKALEKKIRKMGWPSQPDWCDRHKIAHLGRFLPGVGQMWKKIDSKRRRQRSRLLCEDAGDRHPQSGIARGEMIGW